ncbi:tellurite resistance TerB family protein [Methylovulum miyakonense]|uniref:tellurite resistance TerB family protein n=1 Tax=Methylovulum miyakonense TaxID=645578 RepID=UPI00036E14AB|nr:TerB family tellurite resistance protein [Methylovulum miyakonense]
MFKNLLKNGKKLQNRQLFEAVVAGVLLVAAAGGDIGKAEREKIGKLLKNNPSLDVFKSEITSVQTAYEKQLDADFDLGKSRLVKEIRQVSDTPDHCTEVFLNVLSVAKADGEVDAKELAVIKELADILGQSLEEYGLA